MNNLIIGVGSSVFAFVAFMAGVGVTDVTKSVLLKPKEYGAQFVFLKFENGRFHQHIKPINISELRMEWAAKISRNGEIICSGGDVSVYTDQVAIMNPNIWTDDDCPPLQSGDVATASWTYKNVDNHNVTFGVEIVLEGV